MARKLLAAAVGVCSICLAAAQPAGASVDQPAAPSSTPTGGQIGYQGGAVEWYRPTVYLVFWGSWWVTHGGAQKKALEDLFTWIGSPADNWSHVIDQYCLDAVPPPDPPNAGWTGCPDVGVVGSVLLGSAVDPVDPPEAPTQAQLAVEARFPFETSEKVLNTYDTYAVIPMIVTPPGVFPRTELDGKACGHHWWGWANHSPGNPEGPQQWSPFAYAVDSYAASDSTNNRSAGGCTNNKDVTAGLTITASHEFAEAVTDPFPITGRFYDPDHVFYADLQPGWTNNDDPAEIGDPCRGPSNDFHIKFAGETLYLQKLWSNLARDCVRSA